THGASEHLVPVHEEVSELASRTFFSGDEWDRVWAKRVRELRTGEALIRLVNDPALHHVRVKRSAPGVLGLDPTDLARRFPQAFERVEQFIENNFRSEFFVSPQVVERETEERLQAVLRPRTTSQPGSDETPRSDAGAPFSE